MYRKMLVDGVEIYCDMWPCDRECGKFHERFINTTKLRRMKTLSESVDHGNELNENVEKAKSVFEEIMEMAARKDSQQFVEPKLPPLPEEFQSMTLGNEHLLKRQSTQKADTTMIYFDNPVWDDAKFRHELLDSDDENFSLGAVPYIMDDEDTLDVILRDTAHDSSTNPIEHFQADETILTDDDDHDYSSLDLSRTNSDHYRQSKLLLPRLRSPDAKYEKSLTDL